MATRGTEKLTDADCRNASPREARYKLADGGGLNLWIEPNGSRYWRLKYRFVGKERVLALGVYPTVTLKAARKAAWEAREIVAAGTDPGDIKRQQKLARAVSAPTVSKL